MIAPARANQNQLFYRQISNTRHIYPKLECFTSRFVVVFAQSIEVKCLVDNEDAGGAAPTGDAPITSEWSTILLPNKVRLIL